MGVYDDVVGILYYRLRFGCELGRIGKKGIARIAGILRREEKGKGFTWMNWTIYELQAVEQATE